MSKSRIEWTDKVWNPTTGCDKISAGCKFCYAETMSQRLKAMGIEKYKDGFKIKTHEDALLIPYSWKKPARVFVNSMSDLFHQEVPFLFIKEVFRVMNDNPHLTFQVLTKRSEQLAGIASELVWSPNIWMGVSVENDVVKHRIDDLRKVPCHVRFLSCEPLIGPLSNLNLQGVHWAIVGGESAPSPRPMQKEWVEEIHAQCIQSNVAFFFKQWGGRNKKQAGNLLNGRTYAEMP